MTGAKSEPLSFTFRHRARADFDRLRPTDPNAPAVRFNAARICWTDAFARHGVPRGQATQRANAKALELVTARYRLD